MKLRHLSFVILVLCLFSSCSEQIYYQVYKTEHPNMQNSEKALTYENGDCSILYNLWSENGNPGFGFYNKTEKDIFIILPRCFYIFNGVANDYYKNREFSSNSIKSESSSLSLIDDKDVNLYGVLNNYMKNYDASIGRTIGINKTNGITYMHNKGIIIKESPIICIPPKSIKFISEYIITASSIRICNKNQEFPKKHSLTTSYSKEDSPIHFSNIITYSFDPDGKNVHKIENEFWVSEFINYKKEEICKELYLSDCPEDLSREAYFNTEEKPDGFYTTYKYIERPKAPYSNKGNSILKRQTDF